MYSVYLGILASYTSFIGVYTPILNKKISIKRPRPPGNIYGVLSGLPFFYL
ncbi:MAG: hypothetical protein ACI93R_000293 [Flavobacteriales bacterium]|jgi:hypothetical protein